MHLYRPYPQPPIPEKVLQMYTLNVAENALEEIFKAKVLGLLSKNI